jgi:hypothetical protein
MIHQQGAHFVVAAARASVRVWPVQHRASADRIEPVQTSIEGSDPDWPDLSSAIAPTSVFWPNGFSIERPVFRSIWLIAPRVPFHSMPAESW